MRIREMLDRKGTEVVTIDPGQTVIAAVNLLVRHGIGSVMVVEGGEIRGILTERDVLRITDRDPADLLTLTVAEAMTTDLVVAVPDDDVHYAMEIMTRNRVRHLPVVENGALRGIISIGDVVNSVRRDAEAENRYLRDYVQGVIR